MVRPRRFRNVGQVPGINYFKPTGVTVRELEEIILTVDEYEAIRLKDFEGFEQEEAAKKMNISQPTLHRLIFSARKKIAEAIVQGKAIRIEGGNYIVIGRGIGRGSGRGFGRGRQVAGIGRGKGIGGGPLAAGPGGVCVCPKCKMEVPHAVGIPCYKMKCSKCGATMVRKDD